MARTRHFLRGILSLTLAATAAGAQTSSIVDVRARLVFPKNAARRVMPSAVLWLTPLQQTPPAPFPPGQRYTLLQKNRMFKPHLLVIPVGSVVQFPNADPFFHNVFSLFDGKRFDLGLYEAGSTKSVAFSREGVSYIFCNIHPEMGAVVVALKSPYYAISSLDGSVVLHDVPEGRYRVQTWAEQLQPASPQETDRVIQVTAKGAAIGAIAFVPGTDALAHHKNKFGKDYPASPPQY